MLSTEHFKFQQDLQIRWIDLDPLNHVNNSVYLQYFELGRGRYMTEASPTWNWYKNMFLIANVTCDYKRELKLTDLHPKVWIRAGHFGTKSFELEYLITSEKDNNTFIHASGKTTQVMFDMTSRKTTPLPEWLVAELQSFDS
ncbi:acyl-CoA thioesterase [Fulvivirga sp. M361]|uniref:acyl-CoA thioesterase n=1 Tax=Fulvivirga sp. M361 TaxID=2594266 RepID=UPI00117A101D|nr:thioesterase family protein [Fulvivirga sp. M361]TRX61826.1 acyl-CoA thioesterase [Fulvivirga sp. M361]